MIEFNVFVILSLLLLDNSPIFLSFDELMILISENKKFTSVSLLDVNVFVMINSFAKMIFTNMLTSSISFILFLLNSF